MTTTKVSRHDSPDLIAFNAGITLGNLAKELMAAKSESERSQLRIRLNNLAESLASFSQATSVLLDRLEREEERANAEDPVVSSSLPDWNKRFGDEE